MSEETNPPTVEETKPELQKIDKGTYVVEENIFSGKLDGLRYNIVQYKNENEAEAKASIAALVGDGTPANPGKWKSTQIVGIINSAVRAAMRVKAQQEILSLDDPKQPQEIVKRLQNNPTLLSVEDAEKWVPGERELTIQGKMREIANLTKQGDNVKAMQLLLEVQKQMQEQLQAESN